MRERPRHQPLAEIKAHYNCGQVTLAVLKCLGGTLSFREQTRGGTVNSGEKKAANPGASPLRKRKDKHLLAWTSRAGKTALDTLTNYFWMRHLSTAISARRHSYDVRTSKLTEGVETEIPLGAVLRDSLPAGNTKSEVYQLFKRINKRKQLLYPIWRGTVLDTRNMGLG